MQTITGRFIKALPTVEGEGARGHWVRGGFVIEYGDEYPRQAAFSLFGEEKVQMAECIVSNTIVQVSYQPESREYEDRWYTELRCFSIATPQQK